MRLMIRLVAVVTLLLAGWASPPRLAQAANQDNVADRVFGQSSFDINAPHLGLNGLYGPDGMVLDAQGNLYLSDTFNHRVLEFDAPLTAGTTADHVFGQPTFFSNTANYNGVSATSLSQPEGLALDEQGNLYVADLANNRVLEYDRPLSSDAVADRVFGQPDFNTNSVTGPSATSLQSPSSVALDALGNLYVADSVNHRVLEYDQPLSTDGAADRVFGQPDLNSNTPNAFGVSATSLSFPNGVGLDAQGDLYVADTSNSRVLEYDTPLSADLSADRVFGQPSVVTNTVNNGGVSANSLYAPTSVAVDARGDLYVADTNNSRVLEYDSALSTDASADRVFGQPDFTSNSFNNGGTSPTSLSGPFGVAVDGQGNLYIDDDFNNRVLEYDVPVPYGLPAPSSLSPSTVAAGSPDFTLTVNGSGFVAGSIVRWDGVDRPTTFLKSTQLNAAISAADLAGGGPFAVTVFTPNPGGGTSGLINLSLYARGGHDATADMVQGQPNFTDQSPNNLLMPGTSRINGTDGVAVDVHTGRLFVSDYRNNRVLSWRNGAALANGQPADLVLGQPDLLAHTSNNGGLSARSLNRPSGLALDALGDLYVSDTNNFRVLEYNDPLSTGMAASRVFGQGGSFTTALPNNGGVGANSLLVPIGLALDAQGNLYLADFGTSRVLEYDTPLSSGTTADRVFGQPDFMSSTPDTGGLSASRLANPAGVALDAAGNLYVADSNNNRLLEYNAPLSSGMAANRVFGQPDFNHNGAASPSATSLGGPQAVAVDGWGNLYEAEYGYHRVLEYVQPLAAGADQIADRVFGQPGFVTNAANNGGLSATSLNGPNGLALDAQGNLFVADYGNSRMLEYDGALARDFLPLVRR